MGLFWCVFLRTPRGEFGNMGGGCGPDILATNQISHIPVAIIAPSSKGLPKTMLEIMQNGRSEHEFMLPKIGSIDKHRKVGFKGWPVFFACLKDISICHCFLSTVWNVGQENVSFWSWSPLCLAFLRVQTLSILASWGGERSPYMA